MNLHGLVSPAISAVNPPIVAQVSQSTGYAVDASFKQIPGYAAPVAVTIQKQELSFKDLQHIEGLNLQGELCSVYLNGAIYGVERGTAKGGDLFAFNGQTWLVVSVPEQWPDWVRVILCLQLPA